MSNFESTFGSERVLKAPTEPFPVLVSRAPFLRAPPRAQPALLPAPPPPPPTPAIRWFRAHIVVGLLDLQGAVAIGNIMCQFVLINQLPTHCALNSASPPGAARKCLLFEFAAPAEALTRYIPAIFLFSYRAAHMMMLLCRKALCKAQLAPVFCVPPSGCCSG